MDKDRLEAGREMLSGGSPAAPPSRMEPPASESGPRGLVEGVKHVLRTGEVPLLRGEAFGYASGALNYAGEARQRLNSTGKQLLGRMGEVYSSSGQQLVASAAEARLEWRAYFGGGDDGGAALCAACAAPFSHGPALLPEIRRFQAQFDRCEDDAALLRQAVEQLRACDLSLAAVPGALAPVPGTGVAASEAAAAIDAIAARESPHDCSRDQLEAEACAAVTADREAFVSTIEAGAKATEDFCERAAEEEALKMLCAKGEHRSSS